MSRSFDRFIRQRLYPINPDTIERDADDETVLCLGWNSRGLTGWLDLQLEMLGDRPGVEIVSPPSESTKRDGYTEVRIRLRELGG